MKQLKAYADAWDKDGRLTGHKALRGSLLPQSSTRAAGLLVLVVTVPVMSAAAESEQKIEEVVVTAQKREENLQDVGIAITALKGDQLRELGFTKSVDVADYTPGLVIAEQGGPDITSASIRGIGGALAGFAEPPVALVVDQIYFPSQSFQNWSTFDVERVEVLRGPQGVLFGRNTTGGVIQVISREPTTDYAGYGDLTMGTIGDAEDFRIEGAVSGPLTESLRGRLSVNGMGRGDYINNRAGRDLGGGDSWGARGQLLYQARDAVQLRLIGNYNRTDYRTTYTHVAAGFNNDGLEFALSRDQNVFGTCAGCDPFGYADHDDLQDVDINADDTRTTLEMYSLGAILDWDLSWAQFTSVTAYSKGRAGHFEDSDASPFDGLNFSNPREEDWITQEFRLAGDRGGTRWQVGAFLLDWDSRINDGQFFLNLPYLGVVGAGTWQVHHTNVKKETSSWALFGQVDKQLQSIPRLTLLAGLRWTDNRLTNELHARVVTDGIFDPTSVIDFSKQTVGDDAVINDDFLTGKIGANYKLTDDVLLYASYSVGKKSGLFVNRIVAAPPERINRETVDAYEVGIKGRYFDDRMQLNVTTFYYDYKDYQAFVFENLSGGLRNVQSSIKGVEAELAASPAPGWFATVSVGYLDAVLNDVGLPTGRIIDAQNPGSPKWELSALLRKEWHALGGKFSVQGDSTYSDSYFGDAINTPVSGYLTKRTLLNARLGWESADGNWELALNVRNIANKDYYQIVFPVGIGIGEGVAGLPRQVNVQAVVRF